jgi:CDP-diacylglycerol--serine O-phosphatidyltransferase
VPRANIWRRRRTTDMPRPAGRRWARLRRGGSVARQVLVGGRVLLRPVGRRRPVALNGEGGVVAVAGMSAADLVPISPPTAPITAAEERASLSIPLLPGEHTPIRRLKFVVANGCTVASLLLGLFAVFLSMDGHIQLAAIALLGCVAFDGCDGGLARRFGVASPFGAQMDSLADLSSFGVATAIVVYQWLVAEGATRTAAAPVCALVAVCAAIRLARFNVSPKDGRFFCGVPTTMTAAVLALGMLFAPSLPAYAVLAAVLVYALAMVSSFPYAKLTRVLRLPPWLWLVPAAGLWISPGMTFTLIVGGYLVSGPLLWLHRRSSSGSGGGPRFV